jgi:hypothetical protein
VQQAQGLHRNINPSFVEEVAQIQNMYISRRIKILIMDLLEAEVRNDCPGEGQQQFN